MAKARLGAIGFWSYVRRDDERLRGRISELRELILAELETQIGGDVAVFKDTESIPHGARWEAMTRKALADATFFIPIVTPNYLQSKWCCKEVKLFLERERELIALHPDLPRQDRIFPIHYVDVGKDPDTIDEAVYDGLTQLQQAGFHGLRHLPLDDPRVADFVSRFVADIRTLLRARVEIGDRPAGAPPAAASPPPAEPVPSPPKPVEPKPVELQPEEPAAEAPPCPPAADEAEPEPAPRPMSVTVGALCLILFSGAVPIIAVGPAEPLLVALVATIGLGLGAAFGALARQAWAGFLFAGWALISLATALVDGSWAVIAADLALTALLCWAIFLAPADIAWSDRIRALRRPQRDHAGSAWEFDRDRAGSLFLTVSAIYLILIALIIFYGVFKLAGLEMRTGYDIDGFIIGFGITGALFLCSGAALLAGRAWGRAVLLGAVTLFALLCFEPRFAPPVHWTAGVVMPLLVAIWLYRRSWRPARDRPPGFAATDMGAAADEPAGPVSTERGDRG